MTEPITLTYALTLDDMVALQAACIRHNRALRQTQFWAHAGIALCGTLVGAPIAIGMIEAFNMEWPPFVLGALMALGAHIPSVFFADIIFSEQVAEALYPPGVAIMEERTCTIGPEGIASTGQRFSDSWAWAAVQDIVRDRDRVFVFLSPIQALILPQRALPDSMTVEDIEAQMRQWADQI